MICSETLSGIVLDCSSNVGGIRRLYLLNYSDLDQVSVNGTDGTVTQITTKGTAKFKSYELFRNLSNFEFTQADSSAGNFSFDVTLNAVFPKMDAKKRLEVEAVSKAPLVAIVQDSNNVYWLLGDDDGLRSSGSTGTTGTAKSDVNQYTFVLTENSGHSPLVISEDAITGIVDNA